MNEQTKSHMIAVINCTKQTRVANGTKRNFYIFWIVLKLWKALMMSHKIWCFSI